MASQPGEDTECGYCETRISQSEGVERLGGTLCEDCANRICTDCFKYIDDMDNQHVAMGTVLCEKCFWGRFGSICDGCGTHLGDVEDDNIVEGGGSSRLCPSCAEDPPAHLTRSSESASVSSSDNDAGSAPF